MEEKQAAQSAAELWGETEKGRIADPPPSHEQKMQPDTPPRTDLDQRPKADHRRHARSWWSAIHQSQRQVRRR